MAREATGGALRAVRLPDGLRPTAVNRTRARPAAALLLAACLAAAAVGCGDGTATDFTPATEQTLVVATADVPAAGFWEGSVTRPTGGFEYELAEALRQRFDLESLELELVPFDQIVSGELGGADLALSLISPTDEREEVLDFSDAYLRAPPALLTRSGTEVPDLQTARDLSFAVEGSTTLEPVLLESIDPIPPISVTATEHEAVDALTSESVDAVILDLPAAAALAEQSTGELTVAAKLDEDETVAAALPDGASSNAEAVSAALRAMAADGSLAQLEEEWLGAGITNDAAGIPLLRAGR